MMYSDQRPEGVSLLRASGERIPLELSGESYLDDSGVTTFLVDTPVDFHHGDRLHVDKLPAHTSISFPVIDPESAEDGLW